MTELLKNGQVINVFTGEIERMDVLMRDGKILGVDHYEDTDADVVHDVSGKYICPGFIDGHIHIESTTLTPSTFARAVVPHGTTAVVADPHEIANVCGKEGIAYMLAGSEGIPMTMYLALPSCVPATPLCESGARLEAEDLEEFYQHPRVIALGEVMNYVGVIHDDAPLLEKIARARANGKTVNGHAPLLSGRDLDAYIAHGIRDDHECTSASEAMERIRKGQRVMIRQGPNSQNLRSLLPLFELPWASRSLLVTDDKLPADLLKNGHIDDMIRVAVSEGKDAVTAIRMATLWAAEAFGLHEVGAVAPGYVADLLVLDDLQSVAVDRVYHGGVLVAQQGKALPFDEPAVPAQLEDAVRTSFHLDPLTEQDLCLAKDAACRGKKACHVISVIKGELLTDEVIEEIDFDVADGVDLSRDLLKIAVVERHHNTGHIGLGYLRGLGLQRGAMAGSVSHDSHNLIIIGCNAADMVVAGNRVREMGGGFVVVADGAIVSEMPLPIAGLMSDASAEQMAQQNEQVRASVYKLGVPADCKPFLTMAFVSLPVIPHLKMTTRGLVRVQEQRLLPLLVEKSENIE
jgi:adenine deaminase